METVFSAAKVRGLRSGDNPAVWRGNLDHVLPKRPMLVNGHHVAMSYQDVPAFMRKLELENGVVCRMMRLLILTACRKNEILNLRWDWIDGDVLTIPASQMKQGREHRIPLSLAARAILDEQRALESGSDLVFPSPHREGQGIHATTANEVLKRMGVDCTVHGFRSSFRDFAGDMTDAPREVAEACLAHSLGPVERAYRRGQAIEKMRSLMDAWASHCMSG
jgi:integrase